MNYSEIPLLQLADRRFAWISNRQQLLAQNIANADTPGWKPQDAAPFAAQLSGMTTPLERTNPAHLRPVPGSMAAHRAARGERAPDGNGVSLDDQLARVAETDASHELTTDIYRKYLGLFRTALGR